MDASDYVIWCKDPASHGDAAGYDAWRANFGRTYEAGIQLGSSSILDMDGNIVSGPLGLATLRLRNGGFTTRIEAVNGPQTVANDINFDNGATASNGIVQGSDDLTLTGHIMGVGNSGEHLFKEGTGKLTLTNDNTFAGGLTINRGTVIAANMTGSATGTGPVAVNGLSTLGGDGYVAGDVTVNGGTLSPGQSIGTLTLQSSLTLSDASKLTFELGSSGSHDLIDVANGLTLPASGAVTVNLVDAGGMGAGTYTLIDYGSLSSGSFSTLVLGTQPAGFTYTLIDNMGGTSVDLQVTAIGAGIARSPAGAAAVPEPTGLSLVIFAVGSALILRRRRS